MYHLADTGVLLRFMEPTDLDHPKIAHAIAATMLAGDILAFSPQIASEFWAVCTRPKTSGGLGLSVDETNKRLEKLERDFPMLYDDPASYSEWRSLVHRFSVKGKQVHDAKLVALMKSNGLTHIMTLNGADFTRYPGLVIIDPTKP